MAELVFPAQPAVIGGGRVLPTPAAFFLTGEDRLRVVSANSKAGVSLKVQWRLADFSGQTIPNSQDHTPNTDRTTKTTDYELGKGSLLNVTVFAGAGSPRIGETYVIVQLVRGFGAAAIVLGTLLGGYVTSVQAIGFPGSPIVDSISGGGLYRNFFGASVGPGSNVLATCPTGARWELLTVQSRLQTSATVANRVIVLHVNVDGNDVYITASPRAQVASEKVYYQGTTGGLMTPILGTTFLYSNFTIASGLFLKATDFVLLGAENIQAADQFQPINLLIREWLEVF